MPKLERTYNARLQVKLERELLEQCRAAAGPRKLNDWTRQAMREKLKRDRRGKPTHSQKR